MLSKRFNIKMLASAVVLIMTVWMSAFAAFRSGSWSLNPADFRYDMSLYFSLADRSLEDLESYEIGAFVDDECCGVAEKLALTGDESCLYMRIRSNTAQGGEIEFRMRQKGSDSYVVLKPENGSDFIFKSNDRIGMPSSPFVLARYFNVEVSAGDNGSVAFSDGLYKEGSQLLLKAVPSEGYHFSQWSDGDRKAERTVTVSDDLSLKASFEVNVYKVVFKIDGEEFKTLDVAFGSPIEVPEAPVKVGYTLTGWDGVPPTMPANDLMFDATYVISKYHVVFKVDGEEIASYELEYGEPLVAPDVPQKEGYTFNGWGDLPSVMPAHNLEMHSSYTVCHYSLTFSIAGEVVLSSDVAFGASIVVPEAPAKEGMSFSGWGDVPVAMPARDLAFEGSYYVNSYNLTYRLDGETVFSALVKYGESLPEFNAPVKEGCSFSGWSEIPASMPAHDVEINGFYAIDTYTITFRIGDEVISSDVIGFGTEISAPEAPAREGYTFSGWTACPRTMPAHDVVVTGEYSVNTYTVTYQVDEEVVDVQHYEFGAPIVAPVMPEKEGHVFSGWGDVPATMPSFDLVLGGTYADNYYTVTFRIDGVVIFTDDVAYESHISAPEAPVREGYSFNGWGEIPASMPACNLDFDGSYSVNHYMLTFRIGEEVVFEGEMPYGAEISVPDAPARDGHSFAGWGVVPSVMPASDLVINGVYDVNSYALTYVLDGEVYFMTQIPFGSEIVAPEAPVKEGHAFSGWSELPSVMPAHDIEVAGSFSVDSYALVFRIGDEVVFSGSLHYGTEILVPEAPAREGHSFAGWGVVPAVMPASDLEIVGSYDLNVYSLTFDIDDVLFFTTQLAYGTPIVIPSEVPDKDGHVFMGWGDIPAAMPACDLVISGTYAVNHYTLTFRVGDEVFFTGEQPFGSEVVVPVVPEKEGYVFSGFGEVPATMPSRNVEFVGSYDVRYYSLNFRIGDEVISGGLVGYGSEIIVPEAPEKEGHSFTGWGVVPAVMPASDLEITGAYEVNVYGVVFRVGDEVIMSAQVPFGSEIAAPEAPAKEGHVFMGWSQIPSAMPARNIEIQGSYSVESYKVVFMIGEEVVYEAMVPYGDAIVAPEAPGKEGYSFSGWGVVPAVMPAADLVFHGAYEINYYTLTLTVDGELFYSTLLAYGAEIVLPEPELPYGQVFTGWEGEVPAAMPAHDVLINGGVSGSSAVGSLPNGADSMVDVFSLDGVLLLKGVVASEASRVLSPGIYVINGKKLVIR